VVFKYHLLLSSFHDLLGALFKRLSWSVASPHSSTGGFNPTGAGAVHLHSGTPTLADADEGITYTDLLSLGSGCTVHPSAILLNQSSSRFQGMVI
jgi:hypothetical protein